MSPLKIVIMLLLLEKSGASGSISSSIKSRMIANDSVLSRGSRTSFSAKSLVQCSAACHRREDCKSFAYHKGNSDCFLYSKTTTSKIRSRKGYKYYADDQLSVPFVVFYLKNFTYKDAQENCRMKYKGQLACILSEEHQQAINQMIDEIKHCRGFWIGLERVKTGVFRWTNGEIINSEDRDNSYQNWDAPVFPSALIQSTYGTAVYLHTNGKWRNAGKELDGCSVCEIPA